MNQVTGTTLEAVCCCACDLIHLVIFLWQQFVVAVTWFILLSFSGRSLLLFLWLDYNKLLPEKENKKNQVTGTTTNCFQRKITRRIKSQAQQQTASRAYDLIHLVIFLWKQFVVPVTWFILLSFSGSSLLLCLWLDSSCFLSLEAVCCCACVYHDMSLSVQTNFEKTMFVQA
jgi:hypothetical protein